jgi:hypothetical protein
MLVADNNLVADVRDLVLNAYNEPDIKDISQIDYCRYDDLSDQFQMKRSADSNLPKARPVFLRVLLKKVMDFQVDLSVYYFKEKAKSSTKEKSKKEFFRNIVKVLSKSAHKVVNNPDYGRYLNEVQLPYAIITKHLFSDYGKYIKVRDPYLNELLANYQETSLQYERRNLRLSIIDDIIDLEDYKKIKIFRFESTRLARENLKHFIRNQFDKIKEPLNFFSKSEPAYYLISKLCQYLEYEEVKVMNMFMTKGRSFSVNSAYAAKNRLKKRNSDIKNLIDGMFDSNLE